MIDRMVSWIFERSLGKSNGSTNLEPNPNLPPVERFLQSKLLIIIDEFVFISQMIDSLGAEPKMVQAWSDAQTSVFSQITSQFKWE